MKEVNCDVLVIGCGPAGASAARAAALAGAKTIVVDKRAEIGVPVACGEAIGKCYLERLPFKLPESQLLLEMDGIRVIYGNNKVDKTGGVWPGYAVNREEFDKFVAQEAVKAGATLFTSAELKSLELDEGEVSSALFSVSGVSLKAIPRFVVAADGVDSKVMKELGLFKRGEGDSGEIYSWEMKGVKLDSLKFDQIFLGDFVNAGYGYIFPKSSDSANVGVGSILPSEPMEKSFEKFLQHPEVKRQVGGAVKVKEKSKTAPFGYVLDSLVHGNVLFTGDAANQNIKPFVEGILPGVICGDLAGKAAAKNKLKQYEKMVEEAMPELEFSKQLTELMLAVFSFEGEKQDLILYLLSAELVAQEQAPGLLEKSVEELRALVKRD